MFDVFEERRTKETRSKCESVKDERKEIIIQVNFFIYRAFRGILMGVFNILYKSLLCVNLLIYGVIFY